MKPVTFLLLSCVRGSLGEMMLSWSNYYLGIYSIQVCLVWHYILFLSEDCTAQWFCIFSGHFLLPCLLMTLLFCPFLYFLYPTVKHRVSQDTCSSLSGHATLGFLMHFENLNGSPDTDDTQNSISRSTLIQIQIHLLSTKYVSGSVAE